MKNWFLKNYAQRKNGRQNNLTGIDRKSYK